MNYRLSFQASFDLDQIYNEGAWQFGQKQAERYSLSLENLFELKAANPMMARERTEFRKPVRAQPHKSHVVIYVIEDDGIFIIRVRHAHEDWMNDPV
jgi:toxin ParE1/3/4